MSRNKSRRNKNAAPTQEVNLRWIWIVLVLGLVAFAISYSHQRQPVVAPVTEPVQNASHGSTTASTAVIDKDLTWGEQQRVWGQWLSYMREVVAITHDPDGKAALEYIEKNGVLVNTADGFPPAPPTPRFSIVVLDEVPHAQWQEGLSLKREVFATYCPLPQIMTLKRNNKIPPKIMGTLGLHEGVHAMQWRCGQNITGLEHNQGEVYAYTAQTRQFRALYPNYDSLRQWMVASIVRDMKSRKAAAHSPKEIAFARVPQIQSTVMSLLMRPNELRKAFGYPPDTDINVVIDSYLNFASLDASFAAIDQTSKTPVEAKDAKLALVKYLYRIVGV